MPALECALAFSDELKSFEKAVQRGLKRERGSIAPERGEFILELAKNATNDVGAGSGEAPLGAARCPKVGACLPQRRCRA
jgi:hypothetical protein